MIACGFCNAVQIAKYLRELLQRKIATSTGREKSFAKTTRAETKLFTHVCVRLTNLQGSAFKRSQNKDHQDHIAEKGVQFFESLQSCAQTYSYASQMQRPQLTTSGTNCSMTNENQESDANKRLLSKERRQDNSFCNAHGLMSPQQKTLNWTNC